MTNKFTPGPWEFIPMQDKRMDYRGRISCSDRWREGEDASYIVMASDDFNPDESSLDKSRIYMMHHLMRGTLGQVTNELWAEICLELEIAKTSNC